MNTYIISYDLDSPGQKYEAIANAIKSCGNWAKINLSVWAVVTNMTAVQVRDHLWRVMDANDRLFVVKSGHEAAWMRALCNDDWLKENL
jgi:hypothetical protein